MLGNYCRGVRRVRRKWGKRSAQCCVTARTHLHYVLRNVTSRPAEHICITQWTDTVEQSSVRTTANKDGGAVRRISSNSCSTCRCNRRVFSKTATHIFSFLGHLNCSPAWVRSGGEVAMAPERVGETTSKTLHRDGLTNRPMGGAPRQAKSFN